MSRQHPLLLALLCVLSWAQLALSFDCNFDGKLGHYDLSSLTGSQVSGNDGLIPPSWTYFLNMCSTASGSSALPCSISPAPMVCQVYKTPSQGTWPIAYPDDQSKAHAWAEITTPFTGVQLTAYGQAGSSCPQGFKYALIQIQCDPTVTTPPTSTIGSVVENTAQCSYTMQFTHASACPGSGSSGGGSSGLSGGSIFLIVALVGAFVYVAGGCFYKRYQKGTTGMIESCPNNEFWTAIPGLVKDGCMYTVRKIKSLCGGGGGSTSGGTGSYENI